MLYFEAFLLGVITVIFLSALITALGWIITTFGVGSLILLVFGCLIFYAICWFWYEELKARRDRNKGYYWKYGDEK